MSVQVNHYVVLGHKFGYDEFYNLVCPDEDNRYDYDDIEYQYHDSAFDGIFHHKDICIISDGMNGDYVVVGRVLQKSKNYGSINDYADDIPRPSAKKVSQWIERELGLKVKCELIIFTHCR